MMLIGLVVRTLTITNPPRAMLCSSVITLSPSSPRVRTSSLDQVLKPSIVQWLMVLLRPFGCASSCRSFMPLFAVPQWYTTTTSVQSTCPPTLFSISAPNTSRLTSTSFKSELLLVTLRVLHVPNSSQYANIFTKGLPSSVFTEFRSSLNVHNG